MARLITLAAIFAATVSGCATDCPPCRALLVQTEDPMDLTLPYTLELDGGVRCDVVSAAGEPERLRCYCADPTLGP